MTVRIFLPDIPEFGVLVKAAEELENCLVEASRHGYWQITAQHELRLERKAMKLGPALWNSLLSGGFEGEIQEYGRDHLVILSATP
jgi:hypothetical protein